MKAPVKEWAPILFATELVPKILDGSKTVTRRLIRPQPDHCEYGGVGTKLWVREAFALSVFDPECETSLRSPDNWDPPIYRADGENQGGGWTNGEGKRIKPPWRPNIHMPRWASRITLLVTDLRVERLWDITEDYAKLEGLPHFKDTMPGLHVTQPFIGEPGKCAGDYPHRFSFAVKWDELSGEKSQWSKNPWIWRIAWKLL